MVTFLICLASLIAAYFVYGRYLDRACTLDSSSTVHSKSRFDGVKYLPMTLWKTVPIQRLNSAGLGPIFGAILGAAYGPIAFLWITLGGIFIGSMHDFVAGVISVKNNGESLPESIGKYLGKYPKFFIRIFSLILMVIVGAVFMSQPAELIASSTEIQGLENNSFMGINIELAIFLGLIIIYYIIATILPIDKIIGRLYPIFGLILICMAIGILVSILFNSEQYQIPELTSFTNQIYNADTNPIFPMMFITIACGAISGFHATQSPLMARCITSQKQCRQVFYGAMISESIITLIWAAIAMAFWGNVEGLNGAINGVNGNVSILVKNIAEATFGNTIATIVIIGVIACAITSGDTAFCSARLILADMFNINQRKVWQRMWVSLPIFCMALLIIFALPFRTIWSYLAWTNQTLAVFTLWAIVLYLVINKKPIIIGLMPALFMTFICSVYVFTSPLMFGITDYSIAYILGGIVSIIVLGVMIHKIKHTTKL